jgi:hypothetical protein
MPLPIKSTDDQIIRNREYFDRAIIFKGCSSAGGFTDIDACYDVKGKALILVEVKRKDCSITTGQKILFDRLVMWCQKPVYAITAWDDSDSDIILKDCIVREVRTKGRDGKSIVKTFNNHTVKQVVNYIEKKHGVK